MALFKCTKECFFVPCNEQKKVGKDTRMIRDSSSRYILKKIFTEISESFPEKKVRYDMISFQILKILWFLSSKKIINED